MSTAQVSCKFSYHLGLAKVSFKGPLTLDIIRSLAIPPHTILYKADIQKKFPDGTKISVFFPKLEAKELIEKLEKTEPSSETSPIQETLSPKAQEIESDNKSFWERNKRVMTIASLLFVTCYCIVT